MIKLKEIYNKIIEDIQPQKIHIILAIWMVYYVTPSEKRFPEDLTGLSPNAFRDKNGLNEFWKVIDEDGVRFWVGMDWMPDGNNYGITLNLMYILYIIPTFL